MSDHLLQKVLDALNTHGCEPKRTGSGFMAKCPVHDDQNASLSIDEADDGKVLIHCYAGCAADDIVAAVKLKMKDLMPVTTARQKDSKPVKKQIVATYSYCDENGEVVYEVVRYDPKDFIQRRPDGKGGYIWKLNGVQRILYHLPELLAAGVDSFIFIVEGEKDVDRLFKEGLIATTCPEGAGKWSKVDDSPLHGRHVVIIGDNDAAGRKHVNQVAAALDGKAKSIRVIHLPDLPEKGDTSDWIEAGGDAEGLVALVEQVAEWIPGDEAVDDEHAQLDPVEPADLRVIPLTDDDLPVIEPDVMPDWASDFARRLCEAKEVDVTLATLLMLPTLASTCQRVFRLQIEPSFEVSLNIYTAASLESGERKSGVHRPIIKPLHDVQKDARREASAKISEAKIDQALVDTKIKKLQQEFRNSTDTAEQRDIKAQIVTLTEASAEPPKMPQLLMDDFTEAALGLALAANDESLFVTSDEGGLFDNLSGRHNATSEIDLFLKCHDGSTHLVNRAGRTNVMLDAPLLSVGISPQPAVLMKLASKQGFFERGLTARFAWALAKNQAGSRKLRVAVISDDVRMTYSNMLTQMAMSGRSHTGKPKVIKLSDEAYELWKAFEHEVEPRMGKGGDLRVIKPWVSKLPSMIARIAGVCHCAAFVGQSPEQHDVGVEQMAHAIEVGRRLIPHSLAAHALMTGGGTNNVKAVVEHYNAVGWLEGNRSMTDWWRPVRKFVGETSRDFELVAEVLIDHGYLIPTESRPNVGKRGCYFRTNRNLIRKSENP